MHRSNKYRISARGEQCTFQIPGVCNGDVETTVLCHLKTGGMGLKCHDVVSAYGCSDCHDVIDGRRRGIITADEREFYKFKALTRTLTRAFQKGALRWG